MWRKSLWTDFGPVALSALFCFFFAAVTLANTSGELKPTDVVDESQFYGPGDVKSGYGSSEYETDSKSLLQRRGEKYDLISIVNNPPLGLPPVPIPTHNPPTRAKIELGRKLFFDRRLSINNTVSCANCHIPEQGFTNNEIATAVGVEGRFVFRNSPTLYNVAYLKHLFHDGREFSLETQIWQPITAHNEMGAPSIGYTINKIRRMSDYDGLFEAAFDQNGPNLANIGDALASYQRTLLSADSPFDRWFYGKQSDAMNEAAIRGFKLFSGKASCVVCHQIHEDSALFLDHDFHNTGLGYDVSYRLVNAKNVKVKVQLAPGVFTEVSKELIDSVSRVKDRNDLGLYRVTENPDDRWRFRTPTLRNVALSAPYMHNGEMSTLREVIDFYDQGGIPNELLSPLIRPLNLSEQEKQDLEEFLKSLTGSNIPILVSDAFAAHIGELSRNDPNWAHDNTLGY